MEEKEFRRGIWREGIPFIWLSGMAVLLLIGMVAGLTGLIFFKGTTHFWPSGVALITLQDEKRIMGQIVEEEEFPVEKDGAKAGYATRTQLKTGNRDAYGLDFRWVDDNHIKKIEYREEAAVIEREEYGDAIAFVKEFTAGEKTSKEGGEGFFSNLVAAVEHANGMKEDIRKLVRKVEDEKKPVNELEQKIRKLEYGSNRNLPETRYKIEKLGEERDIVLLRHKARIEELEKDLKGMRSELQSHKIKIALASGEISELPMEKVIRVYRPNAMGIAGKTIHYLEKVFEFITGWPRESNTEGGVFPAIFGTVLMVFLMIIITTPLGVLAALYMHEYASRGPMLKMVKLAVNNLAGVPSIVFGIFGLGFFIYFLGGGIDRLFFKESLPTPTFGTGGILWASLTLALLTLPVMVVATEEGLAAVPRANRDAALALGASKFQMILHVVLPNALPGILTGVILAIARGAGEVAPLMITGVVKLASSLPFDLDWPFLHLDRKFMHLGFHIYDVGFQSPNVEAAKPMVYTTTFLLLVIVIGLNIVAIFLRNRLRKKYRGSAI